MAHDLKTPLHSIMAEIEHLRSLVTHACNEVITNSVNPNPSNNSRTSFATPRSLSSQQSQHIDTTDILNSSAKALASITEIQRSDIVQFGPSVEGLSERDQGITLFNLRKQLKVAQDSVANSALHVLTVKGLAAQTEESFESLDSTCKFLVMAINRSQDYVKASSNIALTPLLDTFNLNDVLHIVQKCIVNTKCGRIVVMHPIGPSLCPYLITDRYYLTENLLCLMSNASKYRYVCLCTILPFCLCTNQPTTTTYKHVCQPTYLSLLRNPIVI